MAASIVTKPFTVTSQAFQPIDLVAVEVSRSRGKFLYFPQPEKINCLKSKCRRKTNVPKTLGFALVNKEEVEQRSSSSKSYAEEDVVQSEHEGIVNVNIHGSLLDKLNAICFNVLASEKWNASRIKLCDRKYLASATNLVHYMALKSLEIKQLDEELVSLGLLSLDMINSNVLAGLNTAIQLLETAQDSRKILQKQTSNCESQNNKISTIQASRKKAFYNEESLLGHLNEGRTTRIMVTVGKEAIEHETLIADLLKAGATIIRINCAHGDPGIWSEIIRRVRRCSQMLEKPCRILMDLAGPKLRTGSLKPGPCIMKISPKKNAFGDIVIPGQVWIARRGVNPPPHMSLAATLFINDENFLSGLEVGDVLRFRDARGEKRMLKISRQFHVFSSSGFVADCPRTSYIKSRTKLYKSKKGRDSVGEVVDVPPKESFVRLKVGDLLVISNEDSAVEHVSVSDGAALRIPCSSGYLFDSVKPGEPIAFDDGKIWGVIQATSPSEVVVSITRAGLNGTKLGSEKSINIPESNIHFEGLTSKDLQDLDFVVSHSDMVGVSFVRDVCDIAVLRKELEQRKRGDLGIVLKIETRSGFERLPVMLLEAMKCSNPIGVMIARGDLAVECGWEKLADLQDEIIAVSRAAHVPVIWATQVMESFVKSGVPTRAEITDAANAKRASCVMLNKGKHIAEAVSTLDTILHANTNQKKTELKGMLHLST